MSIRNILPGGQPDKDPYFKNVSLLLSGDSSTNGGQNNTFLDSSSNNFTITRNGNVTQGSFSPFGDRWSNYFNGSGTSITFSASSNMAFTNDLTIEMYVYLSSYQGSSYNECCLLSLRSDIAVGSQFDFGRIGGANPTGAIDWWNNGTSITGSAYDIPLNQWTHIAYVRSGMSSNNCKIYVNGVMRAQGTYTGTVGISTGICYIGNSMYDQPINGNISNLRIIKGTALYTSTFTPPTSPLTAISGTVLLTCQSNRFIDNSTYVNTITVNGTPSVQKFSPFSPVSEYNASVDGGSAYFDGSGDYLVASAVPSLTGDFTVEYWWYPIETGSSYDLKFGSATYNAMNWFGVNGTSWQLQLDSGSNLIFGTWVAQKNAWHHIALVRSGSTITLYQNGISIGSVSSTISMVFNGGLSVGGYSSTWIGQKCNMSNFRMIKGTALYTSNFTPPTSPLTNVPNTQLLCNFTNGNIVDSSLNNDLETVGNAQISTSVKKWGTGSMYFDGSGSGQVGAVNAPWILFGTVNFTVELWVYFASTPGLVSLVCFRGSASNNFEIAHNTDSTGLRVDFSGSTIISTNTHPSTATWHHVALVRNNGTISLYLNGTSIGSTTTSYDATYNSSGIEVGQGHGWNLNGYIDDLRITKGIARYTANFTPPTAPLPKQ